ncbi:MAG: flagellar protein FlaG [Treponemataceae bacterium]
MTILSNLVGQQMTMDGQTQQRINPQGVTGSVTEAKLDLVKKEVEQSNDQFNFLQNSPLFQDKKIRYSINDELNQVIIKIIDSKTDKIVEEIPSVDMQKFLVTFSDQIGLLINKKV